MDNGRRFVVYRCFIRRERFELQLEIGDVMKRWTVINGVPLDSQARRIAVEQTPSPAIGRRRKGRGVLLRRSGEPVHQWDAGYWYPVGDASGYEMGHLRFRLRGAILRGRWPLVRMSGRGAVLRPPWLLIFTTP